MNRLAALAGIIYTVLPGFFLTASAQDRNTTGDAPIATDTAAKPDRAAVTYVTSSTVYVNVGTEVGLAKGSTLTVTRDGQAIATLAITEISSKRAACPMPEGASIRVGDVVTFEAGAAPRRSRVELPPTRSKATGASATRWRGRIGVRFLGVLDGTGFGQDYYQPSLDVRVDGTAVMHSHVDVSVDARTHRTYRSQDDNSMSSQGRARVYRLLGRWHAPGSAWRMIAGRQQSTHVSTIGIFDGIQIEHDRRTWVAGVFAGTQPDPVNFGISDLVREAGGFVGWNRSRGADRLRLTVAAIGSYVGGEINRENLALQAMFRRGPLSGSAIQEVDLNREWKAQTEGPLSITSSFLSLQLAASEKLSLDGGFDTRRNVRLHRNRVTPETEFDDTYRQGYWGGASLRATERLRFGVDFRGSSGGAAGSATSTTARVRGTVPVLATDLALRTTFYRNMQLVGWLHSASARFAAGPRLGVEIDGGLRQEEKNLANSGDARVVWASVDLDYRISRPWYLILSVERSQGDREENTQVYSSAVYRF